MYSIISKIYSYFYSKFVRRFYEPVSTTDNKEEIYCHNNRLVIFIKSEEIGKQIYNVIKTLKDKKDTIYTNNIILKISKCITDNKTRVKLFSIDVDFIERYTGSSKIVKLQELVAIVNDMQYKGYVLDESKFESKKCTSISDFLSLFVLGDGTVKHSKGWLVKHIHYILSNGGNLEEFYEKIVTNNQICSVSEFPYALPVIKMCYEYFTTGNVEENIYGILKKEEDDEYWNNYHDYLIASKSSFESNFKVIEDNADYTIYDGNIKIYHNVSSEFEKFLKDNIKHIAYIRSIEQIDKIIIDFSGNIIGYKFLTEEIQNIHPVLDEKFENQYKIFVFMKEMRDYVFKEKNRGHLMLCKEEQNDFNIEKSLVCIGYYNTSFNITNIKELFNLIYNSRNELKKQITTIFFKLYLTYLKQKYGEMYDKEQFLDKIEVRYLSPVLARELINYALGKKTDYEVAAKEFYTFLDYTRKSINKDFAYDSRFEYVPLITPFIFDYEAEKKFGIKIEKGMNENLADGRILVTFNRVKKVSKLKAKEDSLINEISEKIGDIEDEHVKIIGISEIICSKNIGTDDMYNVVGYITKPIKGKKLTNEVLMKLSNKDFLKVSGHLFTKYDKYYINRKAIWMDNDFVFYINILDEKFEILKLPSSETNDSYIKMIICNLIEQGYNSNAFSDLNLSKSGNNLKEYLLNLANSFNAYCDEHGIYYNSANKMCPVCLKTKCMISYTNIKKSNKVFEDLYAKHYRINSRYNLKVYNVPNVNMAEVEQNIDKIISSRMNSKELEIGQDCFIPYKKALNDNKQFIGYIYDAVQFDDDEADITVCNDIKDSQKLKNLPRLMTLIRLILQVKATMQTGLSFTKNPFSYVFLSKTHKKQVQILNVDFLSEKGSAEDTIKWTCEYAREILASDTSIEVDISDCSTNLDSILEKLQALSKDMTKYCSIHNMYYKKSYLFCPCCIDKVQIENIEVEYVEKEEITKQNMLSEGGEAIIYPYGDDLVAKVFKEEVDYSFKYIVITHVFNKKEVLEEINEKGLKYKFIVPQKLLVGIESNQPFSYIMEKVNDGMPLSSLRDKAEVERIGLTRKDVLEILITVGKGIETLHENNIYIGDLNGRNVLFDTQKNVYFLDFDGMGIDDIAPEFCTDGYIDPVSKKNQNITMKDDWYSFAVQAFYYLTFTHPFNGIYSVEENGKKHVLDITDKMERRISLLGEHGMKAPTIAEPWDWMSKKLKKAFLNIFEGESRESIVPYLVRQYEKLYNEQNNKSIRINPKFIATQINPFGENVVRIINSYAAVCKEENKYYVSILVGDSEQKSLTTFDFPECENINNILLSDDETIAFAIYQNKVIAVNLKTNTQMHTICNVNNVVVNDSTLYFTGNVGGENVINQMEFMLNGEVKKEQIKFLTKQETKRIYAKFNSKFIIVKRASETVDEIYCNSEKFCDINCSSENTKYNIVYDDATNWWLIVNSEGNGIIINASNGRFKQFNIEEGINDINIENISFNKGKIYVPSQDYLYIVNTNDQMATKKMECHKIMTPNSRLYDLNAKGFSVITDYMLYEVRRG